MNSFDEMYILDLHGNTKKKEKCPNGSKDVNVFDIKQGVAIALFIKKKRKKKLLLHADLWGKRESKYSWLQENNINTTEWKSISPKSEFYLFIPRDEGLSVVYEKYWKVTDIFPVNCLGIQTHRDDFVIDFKYADLRRRIMMFRNLSLPDEVIQATFKLHKKINGKSISEVRKKINADKSWDSFFNKILYRPFDVRDIYFSPLLVDRPRLEVMSNISNSNLALLVPRRAHAWHHAFISENLAIDVAISSATTEANYFFPLYLYSPKENKGLFHAEGETKEPNIRPELFTSLSKAYKKSLSPEEIFYYIYSILYSETYRTKYAEFLKIDFPRVPFTSDYKLFRKMSDYGKRLVDLHLLTSPELHSPIARFQGKGDNRVEKQKYDEKAGRVSINKEQYFEGVSGEAWTYQIGGYQVCDKWLKDRKVRTDPRLSLDEIQTYCRIVTAIQETIEIQKAIDEVYEAVEQ